MVSSFFLKKTIIKYNFKAGFHRCIEDMFYIEYILPNNADPWPLKPRAGKTAASPSKCGRRLRGARCTRSR